MCLWIAPVADFRGIVCRCGHVHMFDYSHSPPKLRDQAGEANAVCPRSGEICQI